jgi:alpha-2-macroglobulin
LLNCRTMPHRVLSPSRSVAVCRVGIGLAFATLVTYACMPGPEVPDVKPRGVLGLRELALAEAEDGPLAVVYASPQGKVAGPSEITILFNRAMRELGDATKGEPPPITLEPAIPGQWQWTGSRALSFIPARPGGGGSYRLPYATSFRVTVPRGTKSVSGEALERDFSFSFETERPRLESTSPYQSARGLTQDTRFDLFLSQPVTVDALRRSVAFEVGDKPTTFSIERVSSDNDKHFRLIPSAPLALDSAIEIQVKKGLVGREGALPSEKDVTLGYRTYGPLEVSDIGCSWGRSREGCPHGAGITVDFTNPVDLKAAKATISIQPSVKFSVPPWIEEGDTRSSFPIDAKFLPGQKYTITVSGALVDQYGQKLRAPRTETVTFADVPPMVRVGLTDGVLEPTVRRDFQIGHVNADAISVQAFKLDEDTIVAMNATTMPNADLLARTTTKPKAVAKSRRNVVERFTLSLDDILGAKGRGPFAVVASWGTGRYAEQTRTVAQVTDLGITAKLSREGSFFVVTRLSDAKPVKGAEVRVRRPGVPTLSKTSDAEGIVLFSKAELEPKFDEDVGVVFVKTPDDSAWYPLDDMLGNYEFDPSEDGALGVVFDDRGIYRPGEKVEVKGIVREPKAIGLATPSGGPVQVKVEGPSGDVIASVPASLSAFGTFHATVTVPATAPLGTYGLSASYAGGVVATDDFEVAEFRVSEFKVRAESDQPSYVRGDTAKWTVGGDYLYGAPMAGAGHSSNVGRSQTYFHPPGHDVFTTSDESYLVDLPNRTPHAGEVTSSDVTLDAAGTATLGAKLDLPGQVGPELVRCDSEITDLTRQVIGASTSAIVHPAEHYVGISLDDRFVSAGTTLTPNFVAVDPRGGRPAGAPIQVSLIKRRWATAKQVSGTAVTTVTSPVDEIVGTCSLTSAKSPVSCKLTPKDAGYYLVRATSSDSRKNDVAASIPVYVTGESSDALATFRETDRTEVDLVFDKKTYAVGEKAKVLVKSPWRNVDALVTTERRGVLSRRWVTLSGAAPVIEVPVGTESRPNVHVSVMVFKKRSSKQPTDFEKPDVGAPDFRIAYGRLEVESATKRLAVQVKPSTQSASPGAELGVDLVVTDSNGTGVRSEITLIAADLGVLSLVGYSLPDPVNVFAAPQSLKVATLESRSDFAALFSPLSGVGLDKGLPGGGGGEGSPGGSSRADFRASAYYNPSIVTDDSGKARVSFKLPDGLTTYRLMAMAVGADDRMGRGDADVTSSRALMVRPALPRFLRAGDSFEAAAVVSSKAATPVDVDVTATLSGLKQAGETQKRVRLEPGKSAEVRFAATASSSGNTSIRFDAKTSGGDTDSVTLSRRVTAPAVFESVALYGNTDSAAAERLGDLSAIRGDVGELAITTSSTALVGLDAGGTQLLEYPYGCTEQLTSRLVPLVALRDLQKDFGFAIPPNLDDVVEKTIAKLLSHQRYDGRFGLWADSPSTNPWTTAYAAWGLTLAKKGGYAVPASALTDAKRALETMVQSDPDDVVRRAGPFALFVLAEMGSPDAARTSQLFDMREELPLYSQALLLSAMVASQVDVAKQSELAKALESKVRLDGPVARTEENLGDGYAVYMDSNTRTSAVVLSALLRRDPKHPLAAPLAMGLLADRKGGEWRSTQEAAWALLALGEYRRAVETEPPSFLARAFFGEDVLFEQTFRGRSLAEEKKTIPVGELLGKSGTQLTFLAEGEGRLFYQARLRYARKELPKTPLDRGFFVEKRMRTVTTRDLPEMLATVPESTLDRVRGGDLVLVDLVVVTPKSRTFVAIDDPLPAGFEAVDSRLSTTSPRLSGLAGPSMSDDDEAMERAERSTYFTEEVRDDRVLFFVDSMPPGVFRYRYLARATARGSFVVPPTQASEMYAPEVFGRTGATGLVIE